MNYSDSERIEHYLGALGFTPTKTQENADLILLNTCSIRQKSEDKVFGKFKQINKLKHKRPNLLVTLTGCMVRESSSRYSEKRDKLFSRLPELDIALRTNELNRFASLIRELDPCHKIPEIKEEELTDYFKISATHNTLKQKKQAFIAVSNGCDKFCTYCIVPYSRGREKSRNLQDIINEAKQLVQKGFKEITLIGQTVNSYGKSTHDKKTDQFKHFKDKDPFVELLTQLNQLKSDGLERIRFTSPHPSDMTDQLIQAYGNLETLMPYLHLPVQAGDDQVLKRMNRPYTTNHYRKIIQKLRQVRPDISLTTDIIVGFCGETEQEFQNTLDFYEEIGFEHAYIAMYSERQGTTASRFIKDDIPLTTKKERFQRLNNLLRANSTKTLKKYKGKTLKVLIEQETPTTWVGYSENMKQVELPKKAKVTLGQIVPVKITETLTWGLKGEALSLG